MKLRKFYVGSEREDGPDGFEIEITEWEKFGDRDREYIVALVFTDEKDAALIAAAPALYAALRECADTLGCILDGTHVPHDNDVHTVLAARAALAQADGKAGQ